MNKHVNILLLFFVFSAISGFSQPVIGKPAPDISLKDINGNTRKLSDSKGKIILVDFWASWCMPCRKSNKELLPLYNKYKNKGFEIFAVSLDQKESDWRKAVIADKISWTQVIDTGGWDASVALAWGIELLPTSYLVNAEGTIIAVNPSRKLLERSIKKSAL